MVFTCPKCGQIFLHEMAYKTRSQRHLETRIGYGIFSTSNDNPVDLQRYVIESLRNVKEIKDLCSHVFDHHAPSGLNASTTYECRKSCLSSAGLSIKVPKKNVIMLTRTVIIVPNLISLMSRISNPLCLVSSKLLLVFIPGLMWVFHRYRKLLLLSYMPSANTLLTLLFSEASSTN